MFSRWPVALGSLMMAVTLVNGAFAASAISITTADTSGDGDRPTINQPSQDASLTGPTKDSNAKLEGVKLTDAKSTDLMGKGEQCMEYQWTPKGKPCCLWHKPKHGPRICLNEGARFDINYWEPSEVIEVSCRTGYSMLAPGAVPSRLGNYVQGGDTKMPQTCFGMSRPGAQKWFFEARVWAVNGYDGKLRHQAMGAVNGERARQCTMAGKDVPYGSMKGDLYWGYGKKWDKFKRGSPNGPEGSWEAYISDSDPAWALETSGQASPVTLSQCAPGKVDMQNCWGPVTQNGWVVHSNPKVAAATVAWRAHTKAQAANKVSPEGEGAGFQMMMDYPYQDYAGAHGASMGMKNGSKTGSQCFKPGDAGPEWYGGSKPEDIPAEVMKLTSGTATTVAEINPGVYIFTIWVKTKCIRYEPANGPTACCHYDFENGMQRWHPACRV